LRLPRLLPSLATAITLFAAAPPALAADPLPHRLAALTPADFATQVTIVNDPLTGAVVLSTQAGYARSRAIGGARANDVHLRAVVDRASGRVTWQVWHDLVYVGGRKDISAVHYRSGGAERLARPLSIEHWLDRCPPTDAVGFCNQATRIGFELPEQAVREIAAAWRAGARTAWPVRLRDTAGGGEVIGGIAPAEAAGLMQALADWRGRSS